MMYLLISLIWQKYHVRDLLGAIFNPYQILLYLYCPSLFTYGGGGKGLKIVYLNIRSILKHRNEVEVKPIFHQNAKYLASGVGVGQCTQRQNFALPNAKYTNMLVSLALGDAHFSRFT